MLGQQILVRSLSVPNAIHSKATGLKWQYHRQSDRHSKIACWGIVFDLMLNSAHLRSHVAEGKVGFGINHTMVDFEGGLEKDLDLVLCTIGDRPLGGRAQTLSTLVKQYSISLSQQELDLLGTLPLLTRVPVGNVLLALEAKACMTEHQKAKPRLFSELNSSYRTINGASGEAIAAAYMMINASEQFISPSRQHPSNLSAVVTRHVQPKAANIALSVASGLPRRAASGKDGYDAIGITVVDMVNDGSSVALVTDPPAPQPGNMYHYDVMIERLVHTYATRFKHL